MEGKHGHIMEAARAMLQVMPRALCGPKLSTLLFIFSIVSHLSRTLSIAISHGTAFYSHIQVFGLYVMLIILPIFLSEPLSHKSGLKPIYRNISFMLQSVHPFPPNAVGPFSFGQFHQFPGLLFFQRFNFFYHRSFPFKWQGGWARASAKLDGTLDEEIAKTKALYEGDNAW